MRCLIDNNILVNKINFYELLNNVYCDLYLKLITIDNNELYIRMANVKTVMLESYDIYEFKFSNLIINDIEVKLSSIEFFPEFTYETARSVTCQYHTTIKSINEIEVNKIVAIEINKDYIGVEVINQKNLYILKIKDINFFKLLKTL